MQALNTSELKKGIRAVPKLQQRTGYLARAKPLQNTSWLR